jgi:4-carboxymuconolactone decarboxylase
MKTGAMSLFGTWPTCSGALAMFAVRCSGRPVVTSPCRLFQSGHGPLGLTSEKPVRSIISWTEEVPVVDSDLFQKGLKKRKQVLGEKYVDANLACSDEFMMTFQRAVTELAWGYAWSRPGLDQKTRSLLTLGILGGLGRFQELGIYVNAALASGVTVDEIKEASGRGSCP